MRISDWSSDVCSSDLIDDVLLTIHVAFRRLVRGAVEHHLAVDRRDNARRRRFGCEFRIGHRIFEGAEKCPPGEVRAEAFRETIELRQEIGKASWREREGQSV